MQGGVVLSNDSGTIDVFPGDFGFMQDTGIAPSYLESIPGELLFAQTNQNPSKIKNKTTAVASTTVETTETTLVSSIDSTPDASTRIPQQNNVILNIYTVNNESLLSGTTPATDEILASNIELDPIVEVFDDSIEETIVEPVITGILFPSTGTASYNTIISQSVNLGTLNQINTQLSVNFSNSEVTTIYVVDDLNSESWSGSNAEIITYDADGNFSGNLTGAADSLFGNRGLTGSTSGSLLDSTPSIEDAPATASTTFTLTDDSTTLNGSVTFDLTTIQ